MSAPQGAPVAPPPLRGAPLARGTLALSLATFTNVLDSSIANVSLPAISGDLGVSPNQGVWVITSFAVANAISVPLTGWLTQRIGMAFFFVPLVTLTLSGLSPERIPAASGLSDFMRITAGAMGTSIATTMWESRTSLHPVQLTEQLGDGSSVAAADLIAKLRASGLGSEQIAAFVNRLVDQQAAMLGANDVFAGSALLFLLMIGLVWLARSARHGGAAADAGAAH